ncbi:DNA cytosine methyltransferase [Aquidulcibacter sp.]|uniref:DNA cytosine methyltransferase n=1 Tax=Aquidulcibacter sp. TaxID=2052990 RepID=UPI0025C4D965|nr:DNA cytosine methyltransferase [Aquidulcibacter sp.]MCA3695735.1 DNA cytosine methyltransferase [Aquidulcibacter sp.]
MPLHDQPTALEFFAGGGLARLGLSAQFDVAWANDLDAMKCRAWRDNFGADGLVEGDVADIQTDDLPPRPALAWASFPCQDLSLAGDRAGLTGGRSGTLFAFLARLAELRDRGDPPEVVVLENVKGLLSSHGGRDLAAIFSSLSGLGYVAGCLEMDAAWFLPQSRPRIFIIAVRQNLEIPTVLLSHHDRPCVFQTQAILKAQAALPNALKWFVPTPPQPSVSLPDILDPTDTSWWDADKLTTFQQQLSDKHRGRLDALLGTPGRHIGTMYRRIRREDGLKQQRAEIRFDGKVGCLRTPAGGSSRQFWLVVDRGTLKIRPINPREAMRLMGVPDSYQLPNGTLAGLKIAGDGVAVPVVSWLSEQLLAPLVACSRS